MCLSPRKYAACERDRLGQKRGDRGGGGAECPDARPFRTRARTRGRQAGSKGMRNHARNTGPMRASPRCGAKTRSGGCCRSPGGARQKALPHARRCAGIRRAKGKPERAPARPVHPGSDRRAQADSGPVGRSAEVVASDEMICFAETWKCATESEQSGMLRTAVDRFLDEVARGWTCRGVAPVSNDLK
jgi:hypothetical protein